MNWYETLKYKYKTRGGNTVIVLVQKQGRTLFEFEVNAAPGFVRKETNLGLDIHVPDQPTETVTIGHQMQDLSFEDLLVRRLRDLSHTVVVFVCGDKEEYENLALMDARQTTTEGFRKIRFFYTRR